MDEEDQREAVNEMSSAVQLGPYTLDDWLNLDSEEARFIELIDGHYVVNAPTVPRQRISFRLQVLLDAAVAVEGLEAHATVGVCIGGNGYIPDVVVAVPGDGVVVPPEDILLAVEVTSPSTARNDRVKKPASYAAVGIPRYWRVEMPKDGLPSVHCHELTNGVYREVVVVTADAPAEVAVTDDVTIKLDIHALAVSRRQPGR